MDTIAKKKGTDGQDDRNFPCSNKCQVVTYPSTTHLFFAIIPTTIYSIRCRFRNEIGIDANGFGSDARYHLTHSDDGVETLEVRRAKLRDGGIYKCKVMNSSGWAACDAKLLVQG